MKKRKCGQVSSFSSVWFSKKRTASFTKAAAGLAVVVSDIAVHEKSRIFSFKRCAK